MIAVKHEELTTKKDKAPKARHIRTSLPVPGLRRSYVPIYIFPAWRPRLFISRPFWPGDSKRYFERLVYHRQPFLK